LCHSLVLVSLYAAGLSIQSSFFVLLCASFSLRFVVKKFYHREIQECSRKELRANHPSFLSIQSSFFVFLCASFYVRFVVKNFTTEKYKSVAQRTQSLPSKTLYLPLLLCAVFLCVFACKLLFIKEPTVQECDATKAS
jgi:hypothetical protein